MFNNTTDYMNMKFSYYTAFGNTTRYIVHLSAMLFTRSNTIRAAMLSNSYNTHANRFIVYGL